MKCFRMVGILLVTFFCISVNGVFGEEAKKVEKTKEAEEVKVSGSGSVAVLNRYIFRGYEVGKNGLVIQPSFSASYKGFSVTYWGNIDTNQRNTTSATFANEGRKGFDETDLTLSYIYVVDKLSLTGGYIYYSLKYAEDTEEFFVTLAYDMLTKPTLSVYQDVNSYPGTYINLSFSHSLPVYKDITLDLGVSFAYMIGRGSYWDTYDQSTSDYTSSKYKGFHDGMVKAGLTIPINKAFSIQPIVQYYFPLSGDANRTMGYDGAGNKISYNHMGYIPYSFVGGINLVYNF
jgi:hypothetical protein